jgi:peroxiredoxin Q/BCP
MLMIRIIPTDRLILPKYRMSVAILFTLMLLFSPGLLTGPAVADDLVAGDPAPGFELQDQHGKKHRLEDYRGRWLVMYFYPKADTPGCTTEACAFRDDVFVLRKMNVALLGISTDNVKSQKEFADKYHLPFPLLSDADGTTASSYGSFASFGPLRFARRHTFIIDPHGRIARVYRNVSPKTHSDEIIAELKKLAAGQ